MGPVTIGGGLATINPRSFSMRGGLRTISGSSGHRLRSGPLVRTASGGRDGEEAASRARGGRVSEESDREGRDDLGSQVAIHECGGPERLRGGPGPAGPRRPRAGPRLRSNPGLLPSGPREGSRDLSCSKTPFRPSESLENKGVGIVLEGLSGPGAGAPLPTRPRDAAGGDEHSGNDPATAFPGSAAGRGRRRVRSVADDLRRTPLTDRSVRPRSLDRPDSPRRSSKTPSSSIDSSRVMGSVLRTSFDRARGDRVGVVGPIVRVTPPLPERAQAMPPGHESRVRRRSRPCLERRRGPMMSRSKRSGGSWPS
jgi:hypothetical protein